MTNKTGFGSVDRIYLTFMQLVATFHKSQSDTATVFRLDTPLEQFRLPTELRYSGVVFRTPLYSESELLCDWRFTADQFVLATNPLRLTAGIIFLNLTLGGCGPYITSFLTRGWVCRLQLLLGLTSAVMRRS
jgi:hypothetical protein